MSLETRTDSDVEIPMVIKKGSRIRAKWLAAKPLGTYSLAGCQPKFLASWREVTGEITRIRGDNPVDPVEVEFFVKPDDGGPEVKVLPAWIVEVL
jgi:hypothetical protein